MKLKLSIVAIAFATFLAPVTTLAQNKNNRVDPDHAKYSIKGKMSYEEKSNQRYLNDAIGKGIQFEYSSHRLAMPTDSFDLEVSFDSVKTDHPGGITRLDFWRYDTDIDEWIYDSEVRQGRSEIESTMKTNIMLVIDNSKSLDKDFKKVQNAAIAFVRRLYQESNGKDIFRVGVIGFSTIQFTKVLDIMPLTLHNYDRIRSFIEDSLEMQNGTALYYSLETALNMLEKDATRNIRKNEYKESRIYAFTDGLDQASVDDKRKLSNPNKYYEHLKPMMKGINRKRIMGGPNKTINTTIVTVRGGDMTDKQERQLDQRAKEICDDVRKLSDMSKLLSEFERLAQDLVSSNYVLKCYIPIGASGTVGWTFAEDHVVETPKVLPIKKPSNYWLGIGIEGGLLGGSGESESDGSGYVAARLDAAWPLSKALALGGTFGLGFGAVKLGPLAKFSLNEGSSLLLGLGYLVSDNGAFYMNAGWKFKSPWYINAGLNFGDGTGFSIGVGYTILGK